MSFLGGWSYSGKWAWAQYAMERVRKWGGGGLQIFHRAIRLSESDDEAHPARIMKHTQPGSPPNNS